MVEVGFYGTRFFIVVFDGGLDGGAFFSEVLGREGSKV